MCGPYKYVAGPNGRKYEFGKDLHVNVALIDFQFYCFVIKIKLEKLNILMKPSVHEVVTVLPK